MNKSMSTECIIKTEQKNIILFFIKFRNVGNGTLSCRVQITCIQTVKGDSDLGQRLALYSNINLRLRDKLKKHDPFQFPAIIITRCTLGEP